MLNILNNIFAIITFIVIAETIAISFVKKFHNGDGTKYYLLAVLFYAIVCYLLHRSFGLKNSMGIVNVVWSGISVMCVLLAGVLFFHEKIHLHDIIAASMITGGLMIIRYTE